MAQNEQEEEPIVAELIEASIRPSIGRVSPEVLEDMRLVLHLFLTTHPEASAVIDSLRSRPSTSSSGDVMRDPRTAMEEPLTKRNGTFGGIL
jgi:hypothetical protein